MRSVLTSASPRAGVLVFGCGDLRQQGGQCLGRFAELAASAMNDTDIAMEGVLFQVDGTHARGPAPKGAWLRH